MKTFLCALFGVSLAVLAAAPPPDNDTIANRIALVASGSISVQGRNASATSEASEPTIDGEVVYRSVWWSWTAPFSGPATINTTGSSFDTLLGVFTGTSIATLASIAENDDAGNRYTSSVTFSAIGGVPYVLLVGGVNNAAGKIRLAVSVAAGPCAYSLSPSSRSVAYTVGSSTVGVTTTTGCAWSALSNDAWLTVTAGSSGSGSGTVAYSIAANVALTSRTGTLTVAGLTHTVTQAAAPACTYSISPSTASVTASPITNSFAMTAGIGCAWTATPNASWLTIQSGSSGSGNGTTTYVVATNALSNTRVGTITVAGLTHTVTQAGTVPCTYSISPTTAPFTSSGGSSNIVVSTLTACAWTASSPAAWVTFSTTNGTGNATVTYTVAANASTVARNTTLTVAGNSFTVTQSGAACTFALTPASVSVASGASSGTVAMTAGVGCAWSAVANQTWLTITSGSSSSGNGSVGYTIGANPDTAIRAGTLTIGGQTFTVTQAAAACLFSVAPTAAHYSDTTGSGSIAVTAGTGCTWTAVVNAAAWITIDSGTPGSGNGTVAYTVGANATTVSRTGTITVAGSTFTITQDGTVPCSYGITPSSASYTSTGGSSSVAVTSNAGCTWSASSAASWVTISTSSGSGNGTVPFTVAVNASSLPRTGNLTIAGNPFTVTQTGAPCVFAISPTTSTFTYTSGSGAVTVTATSGCAWTSSSDSTWLTATSGASGTGNGSLAYSVAASTATTNRTGRLTIAGKTLTVTQTGAPCLFELDPSSDLVSAPGEGGSITLTTSDNTCSWTASSNASWLTVSPLSGSGAATLAYNAAPTAITASRIGVITVGGQTFTVTQAGDTTAPTVTLTAPANGSTVSNVITLSATASDDVSVSRVDFYRDSATLAGTDTASPYNLPFSTTNLANGSHTFYARGFDPAGNQGFSTTNTVTISNTVVASTNLWAQAFGSSGSEVPKAIAVNTSSNIFVAGTFTATFTIGATTLTNAGSRDIFLARFTSDGAAVWAGRFGSTGDESVSSLVLDSSDNIFIGGQFSGAGNFGGSTIFATGGFDGFMARYSSAGVFVWSRTLGSTSGDAVNGIALGTAGQTNLLAAGFFTGTVTFTPSTTFSSLSGGNDSFLANYAASDGTPIWARTWGSLDYDVATAVLADSGNNAIVVGTFAHQINMGNGVLASVPGTRDIYLGKFAPSGGSAPGAATWSKKYGTISNNTVYSAALDSNGDITVGGIFTGSTDVGTGTITGGGSFSAFVAKYLNSTGAAVWSRSLNGNSGVVPLALAFDTSNNVTVTGNYAGTCNFGTSTFVSTGSSDAYVARYSSATGTPIWAQTYGGTGSDSGTGLAVDSTGHTVVAGYFSGTANFGGSNFTSSGGSLDMFLTRIKP